VSDNHIDLALHALGGALMAAACLVLPPVVLAVLMPLILGWARESEQARSKRKAYEAMTGKTYHPGDIRQWSSHRVNEAAAWPVGALLVAGLYALR
jgi:hypothetical protein